MTKYIYFLLAGSWERITAANTKTQPQDSQLVMVSPSSNAPQDAPAGQTYPYTTFLESSLPIYAAPDVNSNCVQCVGEAGIYTILSEVWDADGNLWGEMKSGIGWVLLIEGDLVCRRCGIYFPYKGLYADGLCDDCYFG